MYVVHEVEFLLFAMPKHHLHYYYDPPQLVLLEDS